MACPAIRVVSCRSGPHVFVAADAAVVKCRASSAGAMATIAIGLLRRNIESRVAADALSVEGIGTTEGGIAAGTVSVA